MINRIKRSDRLIIAIVLILYTGLIIFVAWSNSKEQPSNTIHDTTTVSVVERFAGKYNFADKKHIDQAQYATCGYTLVELTND